jgi:hypothetical protein
VAVPDTSTGQLLTGGADSVITYWKDNTEAIEKKKRDEEQKLMEGCVIYLLILINLSTFLSLNLIHSIWYH